MTEFPLPEKSESLTKKGFERLYERVRADPAVAKTLLAEIEADPKGTLQRAFKLTKQQKARYEKLSDEQLIGCARFLLQELRSQSPRRLRLHDGGGTCIELAEG